MKNKKSLGQHWLKDRLILDEIANLAKTNAKSIETCLEIGPGLGTLTSSLLRQFKKVIAIEFDQRLAENLPKSFPGKNLIVKNEDILKFDFTKLREPYVVAGNIPYYITSPIIEKLLTLKNPPQRIVLLIQKEVAERIAAINNSESVLSLFCKNCANIFLGPVVTKNFFTPPPKVDSQVIIFSPFLAPKVSPEIFKFIELGFSSPRKKLLKNLSGVNNLSREELIKIFQKLNLNLNVRPANLSLKDWYNLVKELKLR